MYRNKSNGNAMITSLHLLQWLSDLATPRADGPERVKVGPTGSYRGKAPDYARGEESRMCGSTLISYQWKVLMRMTCTIFRHGPRGLNESKVRSLHNNVNTPRR